jgi:hypothetical protein
LVVIYADYQSCQARTGRGRVALDLSRGRADRRKIGQERLCIRRLDDR